MLGAFNCFQVVPLENAYPDILDAVRLFTNTIAPLFAVASKVVPASDPDEIVSVVTLVTEKATLPPCSVSFSLVA